ncbi:hypothetical protein [Actinomycetospora sp. CA-084318]|uniref:hypothetical protein n=1 Tax=Actinomycetospora sp. CA-084318 TaxID=3239892 RepID=UPI003D98D4F2
MTAPVAPPHVLPDGTCSFCALPAYTHLGVNGPVDPARWHWGEAPAPAPAPAPQRRRRFGESETDARAAQVLGNTGHAAPAFRTKHRREPQSFWQRTKLEGAIAQGQPPFPHTGHLIVTIFTGGTWGIVWAAHYYSSARYRYLRSRRRALVQAGLM